MSSERQNRERVWYLGRDGRQFGPITQVEFEKLDELGHLRPTDLLWHAGYETWVEASSLSGENPARQEISASETGRQKSQERQPTAQQRDEDVRGAIGGPIKYRAFLSYAHADQRLGKWLHAQLEGFRIDKELVGRTTPIGRVPKSLRPIFRDSDDFSGGHSLTEATIAALDQSAALIVLCSTVAATRPAVNEEVRLFRSRHPDRPVIPVILDGTFPDNFPPALRFEMAADGSITDRPLTILGPDVRASGDGGILALAKIVATLIGVAPDDVFRRAERARRQAIRVRAAVASSLLILALTGSYLYWRTTEQGAVIASNERVIADNDAREREIRVIVAREQAKRPGAAAAPGQEQDLAAAVRSLLAQADAGDETAARVAELLSAGKTDEAIDVQVAAAEVRERRAEADRKRSAKDYREAAALAAAANPARARELYVRAARLDPDHVEGLFQAGWFQQEAGDLAAAEAAYRRVLGGAKPNADESWTYWARLGLGDIQLVRGDLAVAKASYHEAGEAAVRLAKSDPGNAGWQRDLSVSYNKIGNVREEQGNLPEALKSYQGSLAIVDRLAKSDPGNAGWQRDLSGSYEGIGNVRKAQGNLPEALKSYQAMHAILDRLAQSDPGNAGWQRDLSLSYEKLGDVQVNLPEALASYQGSLAIRDRLAKADPGNAGWQADLAASHGKIGQLLAAAGKPSEALAMFRRGRDIVAPLAARSEHVLWKQYLAGFDQQIAVLSK